MTQRREFALAAVITLKDRLTGPLKSMGMRLHTHFAVPIAHARLVTEQLSHATTVLATGAGVAAVAGIAALAKVTTDYAESADAAIKAARSAGVSVDAYQELAHAAEMSGFTQEQLGMALAKMSRNMADARQGTGKMYSALKKGAPNLLAQINQAKDAGEAMYILADAYEVTTDPIKRLRLLTLAFGGAGASLANVMAGGSENLRAMRQEARDLGIVVSEDAAKAAELFNDDMERLKKTVLGTTFAIGGQLLPILTPLIEDLTRWIATNKELIAQQVREFIDKVVAGIRSIDFGAVIDGAKSFADHASKLIEKLGGLETIARAVGWVLLGRFVVAVLSSVAPLITLTYHVGALAATMTIQLVKAIGAVSLAMLGLIARALTPLALALLVTLWPAIITIGTAFMALAGTIGLAMAIIAGVTGIGLLIALAGWATADWEGFKNFFSGLVDWMVKAAKWLVSPLVDAFEWLWSIVEPIIEGIKSGFDMAVSTLRAVGLLDEAEAPEADSARAIEIGRRLIGQSSKVEVVARFENAPPGLRVDRPTTDGAPATGKVQVQTNTGRRTLATGGAL